MGFHPALDPHPHPNRILRAIPLETDPSDDTAGFIVRMIRVALISMRQRLRDILTDVVAHEKDMKLINYQIGPDEEAAATRPDVIVCEIEDPTDDEFPTRLLRTLPGARILMVADAGDEAAVYELRPTRKVLLNVSMNQVIHAIRFGLDERHRWPVS